jgi:hypothetical protein
MDERIGDKLHHVDGTHRTTPPTASGRALELHRAALERHVADGHAHESTMHAPAVVDTEGRTAEQFLAETFEFELCGECGRDAPDHDAIPIVLGEYGGPYFWARCRREVRECVHCEANITRDSDAQPWWHVETGLPPCNPGDVDPEAYSDCEGNKYDIATPREEVTP